MNDMHNFVTMLAGSYVCFEKVAIQGGGYLVTLLCSKTSFKFTKDGKFVTVL